MLEPSRHYGPAQGLPSNDLEDLALDSHDALWLVTSEKGFYRLDLRIGVRQRATGLPSNNGRRVMFEQTRTGSLVTVVVEGAFGVCRIR